MQILTLFLKKYKLHKQVPNVEKYQDDSSIGMLQN